MSKGFLSRFIWLRDIISLPGDIATALSVLLPSGGLAAVTAWLAPDIAQNPHWVVAAASLVFGSSMMGIAYAVNLYRRNTIFEKIMLDQFVVTNAINSKEFGFMVGIACDVVNHSECHIYYSLQKVVIALDGKLNPKAEVIKDAFLVYPKSANKITFASAPVNEDSNLAVGPVSIEIHYGSNKNNLKYELEYEGEIRLYMNKEEGKQLSTTLTCLHKKVKHKPI